MPFIPADQLETVDHLRMMVMGPAKCGKTTALIATSPGPVGVVLCESPSALNEAKRQGLKFSTNVYKEGTYSNDYKGAWDGALRILVETRAAQKAGLIKTLIVDPFTELAYRIEQELLIATNNDGRRTYPIYRQHLAHFCDNLFSLPINIILVAHFTEADLEGTDVDGNKKAGKGKLPMLSGAAREKIAGKVHDVVWMEIRNKGAAAADEALLAKIPKCSDGNRRVFVTAPDGVWTSACRSVTGSMRLMEASVEVFLAAKKKAAGGVAVPKAVVKPAAVAGKVIPMVKR